MAFILKDAVILVGGYDVSCFTGSVDVNGQVAMKPATTFCSKGYEQFVPGLKTFTTQIGGNADYASASAVSRALPHSTPGSQHVVSVLPNVSGTSAAADPVHFTRALKASAKSPTGPVGEIAQFDLSFQSDAAMVDGLVLQPKAAKTSSSTGTICAMTGPTSSKYLFAALHVFDVSGTSPTLDVKIQSATLVGFGSPTDRITFTQATAASANTAQWATPVAGAITDGFWRVSYTIGGTGSPSFAFAVMLGTASVV